MFSQAATLLSIVVLTRLVAKPALGGYQQLWLIYGILAPFLVGGMPTALLYFLPRTRTREEARKWVLDSYLILVGFGLASSLGVLLLRDPISAALNNQALSRALLFYVPYPFFAFLTAAMPSALVASGRARLASALNAVNGLVTVGAVVGAAAISPTTSSMAAGLSISAGAVALLSTASVVRALRIRGPVVFRSVAWRPLLAYGLPLALTQLAAMLGFQFDRLVVSNRFSPSEFAVYALGAVEVPIAIVVQQAVNAVLVPVLSRLHAAGDLTELVRQWQAALRKASLVVLPLFAFLMVMAGSVITALYGTKFGGSVPIFRAYLFLMPLRLVTYGLITQAIGRTGINLSASLVMLGANVALALGLVSPLGLLGPAIATPLAMLATVVYYAFRLRAVVSLRLGQLLPWRLLAGNLVIAFASAAPLLALVALQMAPLVRLAAACAIFLPLYLVALRLTGRLTPAEWDRLRARLPVRARGVFAA
jgi:O-antigen/teichoic acid export membrane protein